MRYQSPPASLFESNRKRLLSCLSDQEIAIFHSNDILPTNGDGTLPLIQNSDFYYLTGIDQEESVLILGKHNGQTVCQLFIKETNPTIAVWEGQKLTQEQATAISGIEKVDWLDKWEEELAALTQAGLVFRFNENDHSRAATETETRDARFWKGFKQRFPDVQSLSIASELHELRVIKSPEEVAQIQRAIDITKIGFLKILGEIKPGVMEYEIEGSLSGSFIANGSRRFAYTPIIASGKNACVLHYIENDQQMKAGDVVLMDIGAEYGNYNADLTRVVPVNGKFTDRQRAVYQAVLDTLKHATSLLKTGVSFADYNQKVGRFMSEQLVQLGLVSEADHNNASLTPPAFRKYFMHGTSHYLGLDVHDVGTYDKVQQGMVLTCEPGIYIPEEGIGIRLENDLYIGPEGAVNLMEDIPIEAADIEKLMAQ